MSEPTQYLSFFITGEEYGVSILKVREIIRYDTLTKMPASPCWIRGVLNLRGTVVPVLDLAVKFGMAENPVTQWTCVVIVEVQLENEPLVIGLIADSVSQVADLRPEEIEPPPSFGTPVGSEYLFGMGKAGKKFVLLLEVDRLLSASELAKAAAVTTPPPELREEAGG